MADDKPAAKREAPPAAPVLGKAGESSDPVVQDLLARREIAVLNGDKKAADGFTAELADLGVE
jgi:hypothetical protein